MIQNMFHHSISKKMSLSKHEKLNKDDKENDSQSRTTFECNGL